MRRIPGAIFLWVTLLASPLAARPAISESTLVGRFKGVVLIVPAELETEVDVSFSRGDGGNIAGSLSFTTSGDLDRPIHEFSFEGSRVRFSVTDDSKIVSSFEGWISPDGDRLNGTLEEKGEHYLFTLQRVRAEETRGQKQPLRRLSSSGVELKQLFNQARARVRLLLILSSSCPVCRSSAGLVQHYLLDEIKDPRLAVFVVWEPVVGGDTEAAASAASRFIGDPRVTQFWGENRFTGHAFEGALRSEGTPVWDVFLGFSGEEAWGNAAPVPSFIMSNMVGQGATPIHPRLNGIELAAKVRTLLAQAGNAR